MRIRRLMIPALLLSLVPVGGVTVGPDAPAHLALSSEAHAAEAQVSKRIVSIGGSLTETIVALGRKADLIGIDATSVYPPQDIAGLPNVGYIRQLSTEGVLSLEPKMIIASSEIGPKPVVDQLQKSGVKFEIFESEPTVEGASKNITRLGKIFGEEEKAAKLVSELDANIQQANGLIKNFKKKPKVLFIYARGSRVLNISGHSTSAHSVIELAGGANAFGNVPGFKPMTSEAVVAAQPDVILMLARGVGSLGGAQKVFDLPGVSLTPAGKTKNVVVMDDLKLLGFGPRLGEAVLELAQALSKAAATDVN